LVTNVTEILEKPLYTLIIINLIYPSPAD